MSGDPARDFVKGGESVLKSLPQLISGGDGRYSADQELKPTRVSQECGAGAVIDLRGCSDDSDEFVYRSGGVVGTGMEDDFTTGGEADQAELDICGDKASDGSGDDVQLGEFLGDGGGVLH